MHRLAQLALSSLLLLASFPAAAQAFWMCALSEEATRLVCVADADPALAAGPAPAQTAVVNGTVFPLDPRRSYVVDLWSVPTEMAFVEQLARATICYRSPGCQVMLAPARSAGFAAARPLP